MFKNFFEQKKKRVPFPIIKDKDGVSTLLSGEKTYNYLVTPPDTDSLPPDELDILTDNLRSCLNNLSDGDWLKFYKRNDLKTFLTSNREYLTFSGAKLETAHATTEFFGGEIPITDIEFNDFYITVNGEYWCLVNAQVPPINSYSNFLNQFNEEYIVSIRKINSTFAAKELGLKRRGQGVATNTVHRNHEGEKSYQEIDNLLEDLEVGNESLFKGQIWFIVKGIQSEDVIFRARNLVKTLRDQGAKAFLESRGVDFFFNHLLLGVPPSKLREFSVGSPYASNMIPFTNDFLHEKGMYLESRGAAVALDLFNPDFTNKNTLITGMSGEGKSFFVGTLLYHLHKEEDANLAIFDLGGSFKRLCNYLGGTSLNKSFNPLQFFEAKFLYDFIISVIGEDEYDKSTKGLLYGKIKELVDEEFQFNGFMEMITLIDITIPDIRNYFYEIEEYITNERSEPPRVFYLDIKDLPPGIVNPFLVYANRLSESTDKKVVKVFDECWAFMERSPSVLTSIVKTGRKEDIVSIFLSQELNEFSGRHSEVASSIIGNTHSKIYFYQGEIVHPSITDVDRYFLKQGGVKSKKDEFSEFLFSTPLTQKILRLYPDAFFYELMNTERAKVQKQDEFIEKHLEYMNYQKAFEKWVEYVQ